MKIAVYAQIAKWTDKLEPTTPSHANYKVMPILGLAGEIGSLLTELKKRVREPDRGEKISNASLVEELGDILWYATTLSRRAGLHFQDDILLYNIERVVGRSHKYPPLKRNAAYQVRKALQGRRKQAVATFSAYQTLASLSSRLEDTDALLPYLARLWTNSGELLDELNLSTPRFTGHERQSVATTLGDIMWYVAGIATLHKLDLGAIAFRNAEKALSMFLPDRLKKPTPLFDEDPKLRQNERFPRKFDVDFISTGEHTAIMMINGLQIGDPLKDNAYNNDVGLGGVIDGYRFHDCVHLAHVAVLGWSPVIRGLMKRKRKSQPDVDDAEDGARAQIVEEMIAKLTHHYAVSTDSVHLLAGKKRVSFDLLKQISQLAAGLEVATTKGSREASKYWEWEKAILLGYEIFNKLRLHKGGRVRVDLRKRSLTFSKPRTATLGRFPKMK